MAETILVWLRRDLRLADNPALHHALETGAAVVPVFIHEPDAPWAAGPAARWWLARSLAAFARSLEAAGSYLVERSGDPAAALAALARETAAASVHWNRRYEPHLGAADRRAAEALRGAGLRVREFAGDLLHEPGEKAAPRVFGAFWRACQSGREPEPPLPAPERIASPSPRPADASAPPRAPDLAWEVEWRPGEAAAAERLETFLAEGLTRYGIARDLPDQDGTSRLSPHLAFGEIGPRQIWHAVRAAGEGGEPFLRELGWRDFCRHTLHHAPSLPEQPLQRQFADFPWSDDPDLLAAWREGRTGYPIVDAGMRCLRRTGWLHNRVRMIVASFLVKDLLLPWRAGQDWFWDTLLDADLACNAANWQWVAGCGIDAAPYFRIFNPTLQGEKFDARGRFVRRWVPELAGVPDLFIHRPGEAPESALSAAGVRLGDTYPLPIVDHGAARRRALAAYEQTRGAA